MQRVYGHRLFRGRPSASAGYPFVGTPGPDRSTDGVTPSLYQRGDGMGDVSSSFRFYRLGNYFVVELPRMPCYVILLDYFIGCDDPLAWTPAGHRVRIPNAAERFPGIRTETVVARKTTKTVFRHRVESDPVRGSQLYRQAAVHPQRQTGRWTVSRAGPATVTPRKSYHE